MKYPSWCLKSRKMPIKEHLQMSKNLQRTYDMFPCRPTWLKSFSRILSSSWSINFPLKMAGPSAATTSDTASYYPFGTRVGLLYQFSIFSHRSTCACTTRTNNTKTSGLTTFRPSRISLTNYAGISCRKHYTPPLFLGLTDFVIHFSFYMPNRGLCLLFWLPTFSM